MRVLQFLWFHFVMSATDWLPDLQPVLRVRGFLVRPSFKGCGRNLQVARRVTINFSNRMVIGRNVYLGPGCWLHACGGITLEDGVQLGPYAVLVTVDHTRERGSYRYGPQTLAPIRICRGSWVAAHATVTKGVTIGRGAVVAANSVARCNVPEFAVAGGVPARVVSQKSQMEVVG
jgi:acetyltransferase-like isoleucine patch superfamily enzyme